MGNNTSQRRTEEIHRVWSTSEIKANQILQWYNEERFGESSAPPCVSQHVLKSFNLLKNGRSIGTIGMKKILANISPLRLINKINPQMALLLSLILSVIDDTSSSRSQFKHQAACRNLIKLSNATVQHIRFGKPLLQDMQRILDQIQTQLAAIGKSFESNSSLVNFANFQLWSDWAALHWISLLISFEQLGSALCDIDLLSVVSNQYRSDFHQLISVLMSNGSINSIKFQLHQESYFTYPIEGEKRWWLDAKIKVIEDNFLAENEHWESAKFSIVQVCLTKGHQSSNSRSLDFFKGLIQDPEYKGAWACHQPYAHCRQGPVKCVRCHFLSKFMDEIQGDWMSIMQSNIPALLAGIHQFQLLQ